MKVFISWSGEQSRLVAEFLKDWIKQVIQSLEPWISTDNIDRGATWFSTIQRELRETSVGIVCLTRDNQSSPWILFESGALAKDLDLARVCTVLIDIATQDVTGPLAQFNHTPLIEADVLRLIKTLNSALPESQRLSDKVLEASFKVWWPQLATRIEEIRSQTSTLAQPSPRPQAEILAEILDNTRSLGSRFAVIEGAMQSDMAAKHSRLIAAALLRGETPEGTLLTTPGTWTSAEFARRLLSTLASRMLSGDAGPLGSNDSSAGPPGIVGPTGPADKGVK